MEEKLYKRYVDVVASYSKKGAIMLLYICSDDGRKFKIQHVFEKHIARSPVGGGGMRYSIMIENQHRYLYMEKDRWFVESPKPLQKEEYDPEYYSYKI